MEASGGVQRNRKFGNGTNRLGARALGRAAGAFCPAFVLCPDRGSYQQEIQHGLLAQCRAEPGQADGARLERSVRIVAMRAAAVRPAGRNTPGSVEIAQVSMADATV